MEGHATEQRHATKPLAHLSPEASLHVHRPPSLPDSPNGPKPTFHLARAVGTHPPGMQAPNTAVIEIVDALAILDR
jgi:hypothetical protein